MRAGIRRVRLQSLFSGRTPSGRASAPALLAAFLLSGCSGGAGTARAIASESARAAGPQAPVASQAASPYWTPPDAAVDARTLAARHGLAFRDSGDGVLLESPDLRARFWSGSDRMTVDGRDEAMGQVARRERGALYVPAAGARRLERAVASARARRASHHATRQAIARATLPPPVAKAPAPVATPEARVAGIRFPETPVGDPSWIAPVADRAWKWIVVHHSDDTSGCAAKYDRVHLEKGWEHGLGYHFVIGNGSQTGDGEVEVGGRWKKQLHGAHAKTDDNRYNDFGIGIVLVGDFTQGPPTSRQYAACVRLTRWLMARYGLSSDRVLRHSDCKPTCCPGPGFPWERFLADVSE
jgi:hypothetical protein